MVVITSSTIDRRRRFVEPSGDFSDFRVLEFGPSDRPNYYRDDGYVRYVDYFSKDELSEYYKGNDRRNQEAIPEIDYVVKDQHFSDHIAECFDLFVANHVMEHVPDMIGWLNQIAKLANKQSRLFLSLPDKRFTFDAGRENTDLVELYRCHREKLSKPDFYQNLRQVFYHTTPDAPTLRSQAFLDAVSEAERRSQDYADTHCHVFTHDSFRTLMQDLTNSGMVPWKLIDSADVRPNTIEFFALLQLVD